MENKESKPEPFVKDLLSVGFKEVSQNVFRRKANVWKLHYQVRWFEYIATGDNSCGWIFEYYWEEDTVSSAKTQSIPCGFIRDIDHLNQILVALHSDPILPPKPVDIVKPDFEKLYPGTPLNDNAFRRVEGYVWGCEKIWTDYVLPLIKEREELKAEVDKLCKLLIQETGKCMKYQQQLEELKP